MVISKKTIIFQGFRGGGGVQHFPGRGGGGVQMLYISKETHKICDFSGAPEPLSHPHCGPENVSFCPKFWTGPPAIGENALRPSGC